MYCIVLTPFFLGLILNNFQVKEIYNFTQDDLNTEDVLVLDCHNELYVWIGGHSKVKSKQQAFTFGQVKIIIHCQCLSSL